MEILLRFVSSCTELQWTGHALALYHMSPATSVPSVPTSATAKVISVSVILVLWHSSVVGGGETVSKYSAQWCQDNSFNSDSSIVSVEAGSSFFAYVSAELHPSSSYFIRILLCNAIGYSEPAMALPQKVKIVQVCLYNDTISADLIIENFVLLYNTESIFF